MYLNKGNLKARTTNNLPKHMKTESLNSSITIKEIESVLKFKILLPKQKKNQHQIFLFITF